MPCPRGKGRALLSLHSLHQTKQAHTPHTRRYVPLVTASVTRAISFSSSLEGAVAVDAAMVRVREEVACWSWIEKA